MLGVKWDTERKRSLTKINMKIDKNLETEQLDIGGAFTVFLCLLKNKQSRPLRTPPLS